jgi:hypothetical protein
MTTSGSEGESRPPSEGARHLYLATLLQQLRTPAQTMRHYAAGRGLNPMVGLAAELGVRDVLRRVLPKRFGVTSGFMCHPDGSLVALSEPDDVSPQTDVVVYDASRACALYEMPNDVAFFAASDVLGIIEVKDRQTGEGALGPASAERGALEHVARLSGYTPGAFRAIVLLRGVEKGADRRAEAYQQCEGHITRGFRAPHAIYCVDKNYIAVYEYVTNRVHFVQYRDESGTAALADFLRVVASFYAAQGLSTTSVSLGLRHDTKPEGEPLSLQLPDRGALPSLWASVDRVSLDEGQPPSFENKLSYFAQKFDAEFFCVPTTGMDMGGRFTSGVALVARWKEGAGDDAREVAAASFFVARSKDLLECVLPVVSAPGWLIAHERPEVYLQRVCGRVAESYDPFADKTRREGRS